MAPLAGPFSVGLRVDFLCPAAMPGSDLDIALKTSNGVAQPVRTVSLEATPGIFDSTLSNRIGTT